MHYLDLDYSGYRENLIQYKLFIISTGFADITSVPEWSSHLHLAPVVQKLDSATHRINLYPVDNAIGFPNTYPLDSDLSSG